MRFYVKRRQSLDDLSEQPPKDLSTFRQLVLDEAAALLCEIQEVEEAFYEGQSPLAFVRTEAQRIREVLDAHKMAEVSSLRQMETVIRFARDPEVAEASEATNVRPGRISRDTADQLMALKNRLLEFVPGRFSNLIQRIKTLSGQCERYLRAFFNLDVDPPIETAKIYARNILMWQELVRKCLNHLYELPQLFLRGGLSLARIGPGAIDLLERAEMLACPILGIFPDCCDHLREASRLLSCWVERDAQYCDHLGNDIADLESQRKKHHKALKKTKHRSSMLQFRVKQLQSDRGRLQVELESLLEKEADLTVEEEVLYRDLNRNQVDLEIKEFRRDELKRQQEDFDPQHFHEAWEKIAEELRMLRAQRPVLKRRQAGAKLKLEWIEAKRTELKALSSQITELEGEARELRRRLMAEELEAEKTAAAIDKCKAIQRLKASPDVLKKIFYNMPLPASKPPARSEDSPRPHFPRVSPDARSSHKPAAAGSSSSSSIVSSGSDDPMTRVLGVVGRRIGRDWPRLYRALPFVPRRGRETIDKDVRLIEEEFVGDALKERGRRSLQRWSRFHTRACIEDVRQAVERLGRQDLVTAIRHILFPVSHNAVVKEVEEPIPDFISRDLVPFYRSVQKFDRLRAAHRI